MKAYPFKFLDAYNKEDAEFFFGRDEEISALYEMVFQSSILLVYGASGTGKTSLIQCGLASKFAAHDWLALPVRRGLDINANLKKALADAGGVVEQVSEKPNWLTKLRDKSNTPTDRPLNYFDKAFKAIYLDSFKPVYLIFDQFEELFILGSKAEQDEFIISVVQILQVEQPVKMIFSIREEYLGNLSEFEKTVPQLFSKKLRVEPMNRNKVRAVIMGTTQHPDSNLALQAGETDEIAEGIFNKVKGTGKSLIIQLPYLQVFLDKLYLEITGDESRQSEAVFTMAALDKMGDIGDILQNFLEEQVAGISKKLSSDDAALTPAAIWSILSPFATLEGTKEPIDKNELYHKLPDISTASIDLVIEAFINGRILKYNEDVDLYELAHDALAKRIAEKRSDEEIALLEIKRLIKSQTGLKAGARELFSEKQLNFIEPFLGKLTLPDDEKELIDQSRRAVAEYKEDEKRQQEAEKQRLLERQHLLEKNQQSQKKFIRWMLVLSAFMVAIAVWAAIQRELALQSGKKAEVNLAKANKLIEAFYFYDDNYALAVNNTNAGMKYGFISKDGNVVIDYQFDNATPFDEHNGFAKVIKVIKDTTITSVTDTITYPVKEINKTVKYRKKVTNKCVIKYRVKDKIKYLVDTTGKLYRVAYKLADLNNKVTALYLTDATFSSFPQQILQNPQLEVLLLNGSGIPKLPADFGKLKNLRVLDLSGNRLQELPASIVQLTELRSLKISSNSINELPADFGKLKNLQVLDLSVNRLQKLPESIGQLKNLRILNLAEMDLGNLPPSIAELKYLTYLDLSFNNQLAFFLTHLQEKNKPFRYLKTLYLKGNELKELPGFITKLSNLETLDLSQNHLLSLPDALTQMTKLKYLCLTQNELGVVPWRMPVMESLNSLYMDQNQLKTLPPGIENLESLKVLDLTGSELQELSPEIGKLSNLQNLFLGANELKNLPVELAGLKKLKHLSFPDNSKLKVYLPELKKYKNLDENRTRADSTFFNKALLRLHAGSPNCQVNY